MGQFLLRQEESAELTPFAQIHEFALKKNNSISLNSFNDPLSQCLRFFYIQDGKFEWLINKENCSLYPTDLAMVLPGQELYAKKGYLEIGSLYWLSLNLPAPNAAGIKSLRKWSSISSSEFAYINKILFLNHAPVISRLQEAGLVLSSLRNELFGQQIGYVTRVNHLLDELLILITRKLTQQNVSQRDFPQTFLRLEEALRKDLSHPWTVEEMAALVGLGTTAFSDKVKSFTGFSPMSYLINIRISEAIRLLKKPEAHMTNIALETGFYSSQHFATTFKKLTGYTPSQFRKNNI